MDTLFVHAALVPREMARKREALAAARVSTGEGPLARVGPRVLGEVALRGEALAVLRDGLGLARVAASPREPRGHILQAGLDWYVVRPRAEQRVEVLGGEGVLLEDGAAHVELGGEARRGHVTVDVQQVPRVL